VAGGVGTLIVVAATAAAWPEVRRLGRMEEDAMTQGRKDAKSG
jgi:hypothetical protein